jgi:hypothetical protein
VRSETFRPKGGISIDKDSGPLGYVH